MHKQICATLEPLILEITFTIFLHSSLRFYTWFSRNFLNFSLLLAGIKNETKVGSEVQFWVYNLYEIPKECNNMHFHIVFRFYNERLVVEDTILFLNPILFFSPFFANCSLFLEQIGGMYFHFLNWNLQFAMEPGYFWHQQYFILF